METKTAVSSSNRNLTRKSPSPTKCVKLKTSSSNKETKDKVNNNGGSANNSKEKEVEEVNKEEGGEVDTTDNNDNNLYKNISSNGNVNESNNKVRMSSDSNI